jgi:hypothetical protein
MSATIDLSNLMEHLKPYCEQQALVAEEHADRLDKLLLSGPKSEEQSRNQDRIKSLREIARIFRTIIEDA